MRTEEVFAPFVFAGFAGCSVPDDLEDCRVTCSTDVEPPHDADIAPVDGARPPDTPPTPTGTLRVKIADKGRVEVPGVGTCDSQVGDRCDLIVELGVTHTLVAIPQGNREFDKWSKACSGRQPICVLVPTAPVTEVEAKFRKD